MCSNSSTILDVVVNVIGGGVYALLITLRILTMTMKHDIHRNYEDYEKNDYKNDMDWLIISHLKCACISYKKWL